MEPGASLGIIALIGVWLLIKIGYVSMALLMSLYYPHSLSRFATTYKEQPLRCVFVGLMNFAIGVALAVILLNLNQPLFALFGLMVAGALLILTVPGYAAAYHELGSRIEARTAGPSLRSILLGGILAETAFMTPVLGQLFSLLTLFRGLGAVVLTWLGSMGRAHEETESPSGLRAGEGDEP